jgi:hypothetical protein
MSLNTYLDDVLILPHKNDDIVLREIMAEEAHRQTELRLRQGWFVLGNQRDEYAYLKDHLEAGGRLQSGSQRRITHSRRFWGGHS